MVIRWGEPVEAGAPDFVAGRTTPDAQAKQFGYDCDDLDVMALLQGGTSSEHGLLVVNHHCRNANLMWPGKAAADTMGRGRALTCKFHQAPTGAAVCGPRFPPDNTTVFLAIQHAGEDAGSTFDRSSTRWPDFADGVPPRPAVIVIVKHGGGVIGD